LQIEVEYMLLTVAVNMEWKRCGRKKEK